MELLIKRTYRSIKRKKNLFFAKNDYHVPFVTRMKYAFKGFTPNEYVWLDLANNDYRDYISDYQRVNSREINGAYKIILDDKLLFEEIFRRYARVPAVYAWVSYGVVYGIHEYEVDNSSVLEFIRKRSCVVLKWETGYEGKGTYIIRAAEGNESGFSVNGKNVSAQKLLELFSKPGQAILCEFMQQSGFEHELYPDSTNTIRMICEKKKDEKTAHVVKAAQRIGNHKSAPLDNVSAGAISCEIDIDSGKLLAGVVAKTEHNSGDNRFFDTHPDSGAVLTGREIPDWQNLKKEIEDLTNQFPYLNLVAWDVLLTDGGFCLIEGNASSGLMMFQQRHGVRNEEIGDIYRSYGLIK